MKTDTAGLPAPPVPAPNWALFLDLDGTLVDIAPRPDLVSIPADLASLLAGIDAALGGALALVSGRSIDVLDQLLKPWHGVAAGEHGAALRLPSGALEVEPGLPPVPRGWRDEMAALAQAHRGVVVEQKSAGIAVHFRQAPEAEAAVCTAATALAARGSGFAALPGSRLIEIRPLAVNKGWAVHRLMREFPFKGRVPVFVGDDVTDEDGFRAARALGGHGLNVHLYFPAGAVQVREWLVDIVRVLQAKSSA
ncbi:MAG: trehalose-phosphatase [Rhodospirillales bacterium]